MNSHGGGAPDLLMDYVCAVFSQLGAVGEHFKKSQTIGQALTFILEVARNVENPESQSVQFLISESHFPSFAIRPVKQGSQIS